MTVEKAISVIWPAVRAHMASMPLVKRELVKEAWARLTQAATAAEERK